MLKYSEDLKALMPLLKQGYAVQLSPEVAKELYRILLDYPEAIRQMAMARGW